jgi:flagellar basal-body rod protein FlgF
MISALLAGNTQTGASEVGRLKLVNPPTGEIERGDDGLFRTKAGAPAAQADPAVKVSSGAIEGSNVNAVDAMVAMIANARRFEMHMKTIQAAESNDQQANKLLSTT